MTRRITGPGRRLAAVSVAAVVAVWAFGPAAGAHDGKAVITVEAATPAAAQSVSYTIRVVWDNDGHPAKDATVTAVGVGLDGDTTNPINLQPADTDGRYAGTVSFPTAGAWTVRFTVVTPPGMLEVPQIIEATTATPSPSATAETPTTATPTSVSARSATSPTADPASTHADEDWSSGWLIGVAALLVLAFAVVVDQVLRRRRRQPSVSGQDGTAVSEPEQPGHD